ncbi:ATP-binding protein [Novosphingobium sp. PS1R-30]|uniref:histidine kinase n=1 Tax=Novosphingobium anseongense TaxID=3133436 RepID=A0ABU8S2U6_9SPHN
MISTNDADLDAAELFAGGGEVRSLARELDWSKSPLGPTTSWSPAIRTMARSMFDSPFPICLWSGPDFALVYNDPYRRILAAKHPAALGKPGSVVWAEIWEELQPQFEGVRAGGDPVYFENSPFIMARLEGGGTETAYFNYSLSPLRDEDGSIAAVLNITPETTERVLLERRLSEEQIALISSEQALRESEARLRHLNETLEAQVAARSAERDQLWSLSQDMLARADYSGMMSAVSPAWTHVLGWTEGELLSRGYATFMHSEDMPPTLEAIARMAETRLPTRFENRIATSAGVWKPIEWTVAPEPDGFNFIAVGRDVSEAKDREAELNEAHEALRQSQKMEAVGQLTGGIAHDFNNLLAGISGSLEIIERRLAQGRFDGLERFISGAQSSAQRAASLTQRLLAFSRRQTLDPKPTDVNRLVHGMEDLVGRTVGPAIAVEVVGAAGLWPTRVDAAQLENALLNLAINARDAMPDGGRITIETANKWLDDRGARERDLKSGQYISICVTDTGTGIAEDIADRIFDPFFTTKPIGQGTGLGLSMIHGFVRQSGGQVRVYSEAGKGTTMCLYLPRYTGEFFDESQPPEGAIEPMGAGETVLVIDDEPIVRMLIVEVLEEAGYLALEAGDGASGLKILQSDARIDLLITDVGLPGGMNGRQVADAARLGRPDLKILFVTGYAENAAVGNGHLDPGMEVITKPFVMTELANKITELIES